MDAFRAWLKGFVMALGVSAPVVYATAPAPSHSAHAMDASAPASAPVPFDQDPKVRAYLEAVAKHDVEVRAWEASRHASRISGYAPSDVAQAARQVARDADFDAINAMGTGAYFRLQTHAMHLNQLANALEDAE